MTQSALKSNVEWNVEIISKQDAIFIKDVIKEFDQLWERSIEAESSFISQYEELLNSLKRPLWGNQLIYENKNYIIPNRMQKRAMDSLERLRGYGENKALVVSATGTGKTYMSAFDVKNFKPNRLLFIVHREEILRKAKKTFEFLLGDHESFGLFTGTSKESKCEICILNHSNFISFF